MSRELVKIKSPDFQGFGCSVCGWLFKPADEVVGISLDEMKRAFEAQRDQEFFAHISVKPSKTRQK
jgi:hypothetical protein